MNTGASEPDPALDPIVYAEVRRIAGRLMSNERQAHTLQPTALVNEAYVRLMKAEQVKAEDRGHFVVLAARTMRRILVDHARARGADKRGAGWTRVTLSGLREGPDLDTLVDLLALEQALEELSALDPRRAAVVELRAFGGLTNEEVAGCLGRSTGAVSEDWRAARAWLGSRLAAAGSDLPPGTGDGGNP